MATAPIAVTNLTDAPGCTPQNIDIFNASLAPGEQVLVPAHLITDKLQRLVESRQLSIGPVPEWYRKAMRGIKSKLTKEEVIQLIREQAEAKERKDKANEAAKAAPVPLAVLNVEGAKKAKLKFQHDKE